MASSSIEFCFDIECASIAGTTKMQLTLRKHSATWVLVLVCLSSIVIGSSVKKLNSDVLRLCIDFGMNEDQKTWRLLCHQFNAEFMEYQRTTRSKILQVVHFLENMNDSDPFTGNSSLELLSVIKSIKLNQEYLIRLPFMLYRVCDQVFEQNTSNKSALRASKKNLQHLFSFLFDTALYEKTSHIKNVTLLATTNYFTFFPILVNTSRKIMNRALQTPTKQITAEFDCLRFLYAFLWDHIQRQNDSLLPRLDELYYLEKNLDIPLKRKQLEFVRELMDAYGLIFISVFSLNQLNVFSF